MKKQKTQSKIIVALTAVVILLVAISATLTFAYFTANANETSDTMTFGKMGIEIDDFGTGLAAAEEDLSCSLDNLVPGCTFTGSGAINIKNNIDTFLRFRLVIASVTPRNGSTLTAADLYAMLLDDNAQGGQTMTVTLSANGENTFIKGEDGTGANTAWYYTKIAADSTFEELTVISLSRLSFTLPTSLGNEYQGATFTLRLEVQAIQAEHLTFVDTENSNAVTDVDVTVNNSGVITALGDLEAATAWPALNDNTSVDYFA